MAQSAGQRETNTSFDSGCKSRTESSTSSVIMDAEEISSGASNNQNGRSTKSSSTSSYSSCNDMGEEVWNNFVFKPVQPEDYSKVLAHMRESFYRDEPLNAITGYSEEKAQDMDLMISNYYKDGLCTIVLERGTNVVAGARIISTHKKNSAHSPMKLISEEMNKIMPFLDKLDKEAAIFDHYPELEEYAELFMVSVHPEFRGQGLAGEMYRGAIRLLQSRGFKLLKSCFTSKFTARIGEKIGFQKLLEAKFNEYRDETGELVFSKAKDDEMAVIGVLEL